MLQVDLMAAGGARLTSDAKLTPDDFRAVAGRVGVVPFAARKSGLISAVTAAGDTRVETRWNGKETVNTARPGDRIVTNLDARGKPLVDRDGQHNVYVIKADAFVKLYELADTPEILVATYRARGIVEAIALPGGFDILAPWGETQWADRGYLILNGADVYGNNADTFEATYERVAA
jgi:hypothetical protein